MYMGIFLDRRMTDSWDHGTRKVWSSSLDYDTNFSIFFSRFRQQYVSADFIQWTLLYGDANPARLWALHHFHLDKLTALHHKCVRDRWLVHVASKMGLQLRMHQSSNILKYTEENVWSDHPRPDSTIRFLHKVAHHTSGASEVDLLERLIYCDYTALNPYSGALKQRRGPNKTTMSTVRKSPASV
jgi:hypothetical protein